MKHWIAFDAAGTLFEPAEPVENVYADCFSTLGFGLPEATWKTALERAFQLTHDPSYGEAEDGEIVEKDWWRRLVRNATDASGIRPDPETMDDAFEELFDHYASATAWRLFPETESVLTFLKAKGIGLCVTSNFDSRLLRVLEGLGIESKFDFILTSAEVGARKPSPRIITHMIGKAGAEAEFCCLAGDSPQADGGAAESAGIAFYHVQRPDRDLQNFQEWHSLRFP